MRKLNPTVKVALLIIFFFILVARLSLSYAYEGVESDVIVSQILMALIFLSPAIIWVILNYRNAKRKNSYYNPYRTLAIYSFVLIIIRSFNKTASEVINNPGTQLPLGMLTGDILNLFFMVTLLVALIYMFRTRTAKK